MVERYVGYYFSIQFDIDFIIDCIGSGCRGRSYYYYSLVVEDGIIIIYDLVVEDGIIIIFGAVGS